MGILLDTNVWIAIERGSLAVADVYAITRQTPVYISPVNLAEITLGIELMSDPASRQRALNSLRKMRRLPLLRISGETAEVFGAISAAIINGGRGAKYRVQDLWIASQAVQRDFTLITSNGKDFQDIPGLKLIVMNQGG